MRFQLFTAFGVLTLILAGALWFGADLTLRSSFASYYRNNVQREAGELLARLQNLDEKQIREELRRYRLGQDGYAFLSRPGGQELFHTEREKAYSPLYVEADGNDLPALIASHPQGTAVRLGQDLSLRYVAFLPIPDRSLLVGVSLPVQETAVLLDQARTGLWAVSFGLAMAGLLASWMLASILARPIQRLVRYAEQLAVGEEAAPPDVSAPELLELVAELSVLSRRPLPEPEVLELSGAERFQQALFEKIDAGAPFAAGLVDLTYFGPFVRRYGAERGELVVRHLGILLENALGEFTYRDHQLFHLAPELPDQYAFLMPAERIEELCQTVIARFDREVADFYKPDDRKRGEITGKNRQGDFEQYPFMQVGVAIATNLKRPLIHPVQIGAIFQEIRGYLKTQKGSGFLVDRRTADRDDSPAAEVSEASEGVASP